MAVTIGARDSSTTALGAARPNGSGAAHGHTTNGGVMNFSNTSTHKACFATGPMRRVRPIIATVAASAVVMTMFWKSHQAMG
jgi:hypothetical protein